MSESKRFIENISSNYFIFAFKLGLGLYALPVCLHAFGAEQYGLYIIFFGLATSLAAFDFGSSKSVFRYTVEFHADNDTSKYQQALNASFSFNLYAAIIISVILLFIGLFSQSLFNLSQQSAAATKLIAGLAAANAFIITLAAVPQNLLTANKLFLLRNKFQLVVICLNLLVILGIQFTSWMSLNYFALFTTIITLISFIGDIYLVKKKQLLKNIKLTILKGKAIFKTPFSGYSMQVFLLSLISFLAVQADRFVIASVLDVASVTIYTIITKPYFVLRGINAISFPVVQPILNKLNLEENKKGYIDFIIKITRVGFLFMLCITVITIIFYHEVLIIWLGTDEYNTYIKWGALSLISLCINMLYSAHFRTLIHTKYIKQIINFSFISVLGNIIISVCLSKYYGFQGVIIGTFVQIIAECIFSYYLLYKNFSQEIKRIKWSYNYIGRVIAIIGISLVAFYFETQYELPLLFTFILFAGLTVLLGLVAYHGIKNEQVFKQFNTHALKPQSELIS